MSNFDNPPRRFTSGSSDPNGERNDRSVMADPFIGFELEGQYLIEELIGAGGWGNVYKASGLADGKTYAIKIVHKHHMQNELSIKRFEQEAKTLSRIKSHYVVQIIDHGFSPTPYIVMEYFDGMPLNKWLKVNGSMNSKIAIDLFLQLCDGLTAAEAIRIVHRDLKPANIMLRTDGSRVQAKILDFGLAKFVDQSLGADKLTSTGDVLGSPPYMSPEQWKGQCDNRSDIYALGCIMYELLAGRPAFTAEYGMDYLNKHMSEKPAPISEINTSEKLPAALEDIVKKCMAKSPDNRYQSSSSCTADLKKVKLGKKPIIDLAEEQKAPESNRKWLVVSGIAVAVVVILLATFLLKEAIARTITANLYSQAEAKMSMGQSNDAIDQYRQILFWSQLLPAKDMQKLSALRTLASLLRDRKEYTAADSLQKQSDVLIGDINSNQELLVLVRKIKKNIASDNLPAAELLCGEAMELASSKLGKTSMAYASCLDLLGAIAYKKGSFEKAIGFHKEALALTENLLDPNDLRRAAMMEHLSTALKSKGDTDEAEKYSELALSIKSSAKPSKTSEDDDTNLSATTSPSGSNPSTSKNSSTASISLPSTSSTPAGTSTSSTPTGASTTTAKTASTAAKTTSTASSNPSSIPAKISTLPAIEKAKSGTATSIKAVSPVAINTSAPTNTIQAVRSSTKTTPAKTIAKTTAPATKSTVSSPRRAAKSGGGWNELEKLRGFK